MESLNTEDKFMPMLKDVAEEKIQKLLEIVIPRASYLTIRYHDMFFRVGDKSFTVILNRAGQILYRLGHGSYFLPTYEEFLSRVKEAVEETNRSLYPHPFPTEVEGVERVVWGWVKEMPTNQYIEVDMLQKTVSIKIHSFARKGYKMTKALLETLE